MSRPPPPPFPVPKPFAHAGSTNTRRNVTGDPAYPQGGPTPGHVQPPEMTSPTSYPSQQYPSHQYSSSQPSPTPSRRSTLPTTSTYGHASLPPHQSVPAPLSGSASYHPSFPVPAVSVGHPSTSGPAPPAPPPMMHRAATIPMPVRADTASSVPYGIHSPYPMHPPSQPGFVGGPQPTAQDWSYLDILERNDDSDSSDEDPGRGREGAHHSSDYMQERSPGNPPVGRQRRAGGHGGNTRSTGLQQPTGSQQPELLRCKICGRLSTRWDAEYRRWRCIEGHGKNKWDWELA